MASKAVPSVIASSVCWSLQCLISALIQRGRWWTPFFFFLGSLVQSRCGEGGTLQTKNTACACSASATLGLPLLTAHVASLPHCSGSRLLRWEPSAAGPGLLAPPRSKPLRFRHSGSPQRHRLGSVPSQTLPRPFPDPSSSDKKDKTYTCLSMMRCLVSVVAATYRLPSTQLSGCTTGAPSQEDVDYPEPQEVLVSKEACFQFCR